MTELTPLLNVEDVSSSIDFYAQALGAQVEAQWPDEGRVRWARIRFEGGAIMLNEPDGVSSTERRTRAEFADCVLYVTCRDAEVERARLVAGGLDAGPLSREDYGNDEFSIRDPDGYAIRFSSAR